MVANPTLLQIVSFGLLRRAYRKASKPSIMDIMTMNSVITASAEIPVWVKASNIW